MGKIAFYVGILLICATAGAAGGYLLYLAGSPPWLYPVVAGAALGASLYADHRRPRSSSPQPRERRRHKA